MVCTLFDVGLHIVWTKLYFGIQNCICTRLARSRTGNRSRRSRSPSAQTYPYCPSCLSSPGNGTGAPPAQTSTCPGWARNRRYLITECSLMYSESFSLCFFGSNSFANCSKPIVKACILTSMQRMSHPMRSLSPPPEIALKSVCHATLCFPAC